MDTDLLLMTPGPLTLDSEVLLAGAQPLQHHRTKDFAPLYSECIQILKRMFHTQKHLFLTLSSGTGAMETAIANHFHPGEQILTVETGAFGERFSQIARSFRLDVIPLRYPWGHRAKVEDLAKMIDKNPNIKGVTITFNETSTGVKNDLKAFGEFLKDKNILFITDGVSGIGALPFEMDAWNVDVAISASHKGFLAPPGVGIVALSDRAYEKMQSVSCNGFYFDLKHYKRNQDLPISSYPWTPPISVMFALHTALLKIEKRGMEKVFSHCKKLSEGLREAIKALGLTIFTQPDALSEILTVINSPQGIHPTSIVKEIHESYNVLIAGGQGEIVDKVFRIATIGAIGERDIISTVGLLELALYKLNYLREFGLGVAALLKYFAEKTA